MTWRNVTEKLNRTESTESTEKYWKYWKVLNSTEKYWIVLKSTEKYWKVLKRTESVKSDSTSYYFGTVIYGLRAMGIVLLEIF